MQTLFNLLIGFIIGTTIGYWGYKRKSLSKSGLAGFVIISTAFWGFGSWAWFATFFVVFLTVTLLTKYRHTEKLFLDDIVAKTGPRDIWQALANFLVAIVVAFAYKVTGNSQLVFVFLGAIAAANADTWATELGTLSKQPPRLITTFEVVQRGRSGAISPLGTIAGIIGSGFVAIMGGIFLQLSGEINIWFSAIVPVCIAGTLGTITDSILGATVQANYYSEEYGAFTEHTIYKGRPTKLKSGSKFINNETVNFICTLIGATSASLIA